MSLKKRHNTSANPDNALTLTHDVRLSGCCPDDQKPANQCVYTLLLDKSAASNDQITAITIDGTEYTFAAAVDTTQSEALVAAALRTQIEAVISDNFSRSDGWDYQGGLTIRTSSEISGQAADNIRIKQYDSQAVINNLRGGGGSPGTYAFTASNCVSL